ncbi:MAG TPA: CopD family protein [Chloroflexia bacterium]|nr:CopD family protein [Chloroflexia bacterium]
MGSQVVTSSKKPWIDWLATLVTLILLALIAAGIAYLGNLSISSLLIALSNWLHLLATIVMIGYFIFTSLIFLPVIERQMSPEALRALLEQVSARLRPYFGGALLIFLVTGTHLMLNNQNYLGLGKFFDNPWSSLMVIKHVLVLGFLVLAVFSERVYLPQINQLKPEALKRFRLALNINTVLGLIILLLTALAQTAALA